MAVSAARGALEDITVGVGRVLGAVWRASLCLPSLLRARSPGGRKQISQSTTAAFNLRSHWPRDQPKKEERGRITRGHTPTIVAPPTRPPPPPPIGMATTSAVAVSAASAFAGSALSNRRVVKPVRASRVVPRASASGSDEKDAPFDARAFRRELSKSPKYNRSFKKDEESADAMETAGIGMVSKGGLVAQMRVENFTHVKDDVTLKLADAYGFCWGVERAVQMAYEARKQYPHEQIHITNEIIHNPTVNKRLEDMGVKFIAETKDGKDFSGVKDGEVVILPAFGASVHEMKLLAEKGVSIVDTTCPWVSKVWNAVDSHKKKEFTSIIHGKWAHEETVATVSFAGVYLVVKDLAEAEYVCDYILNGGDKAAFMKKFDNAHSKGFDPETDLIGLGIANQTTMLKGETEMIGKVRAGAFPNPGPTTLTVCSYTLRSTPILETQH